MISPIGEISPDSEFRSSSDTFSENLTDVQKVFGKLRVSSRHQLEQALLADPTHPFGG
jgi:hypothetical protein